MDVDSKKKDPDSFSLDPENPESSKRPSNIDTQMPHNTYSPMTTSPRLHKIDSFSQDDVRPTNHKRVLDNCPPTLRMTLGLCKSFSKDNKTTKKITNLISTLDENMRNTEAMVKRQEKRVDEYFHEVYDLFVKNFSKVTESYRHSMKSKLQLELSEYRYVHDNLKSNLEYMMTNDSSSKLLEQELYNISASLQAQSTSTANILSELNSEKPDLAQMSHQFLEDSLEMKTGLTPLTKKYNLIDYVLKQKDHYTQAAISPSLSELKKDPFKDFANINTELENFIQKVSQMLNQDLPSIVHPHASHVHVVEKIARAQTKFFPFDTAGKSLSHSGSEENLILKKRLSILETEVVKTNEEGSGLSEDKENKENRESKSPRDRSPSENKIQTSSLTPVKSVLYRLPTKENMFTANQGWFNEEFSEISYQSQTISVHNNLTVGDLVSVNGSPHRIIHKEWTFPNDTVHMVNIFTGEKIEEVHHSRLNAMVEQIITKKYQIIRMNKKQEYYLLMDMAWDKSENFKRLPKIIETKNVLDKRLEDDIKDALLSDKRVVVHVLKIKDEDIIVSYRKERF